MFHLGDVMAHRGRTLEETAGQTLTPPSQEEIRSIMQKREEQSEFNQRDLFFTGKMNISEQLPKMISALVQKTGIVPPEKATDFMQELKEWESNQQRPNVKAASSKRNLGLMYKCMLLLNCIVLVLSFVLRPVFLSKSIIGDKIDIPNCTVMKRDRLTGELLPTNETVEIH